MNATLQISRPVLDLGTESAYEILARAKHLEASGRDVVHLQVGEPDVPTPIHIVEAGVRALRGWSTRYAPAAGIPALRAAIADSMRDRGIVVTPEQVIVTSGSKPMLFYALMALVSPGDEVLVPDPGFPIFPSVVSFAGGQPIGYTVHPDRPSGIDPVEIAERVTTRTRVLVLNSPHNPTGTAIEPAVIAEVAELACSYDLAIVTDEIYSRLLYRGTHKSIAALHTLADRTVVVDGFSKAYAMTGWRLGYGIMPLPLARRIERFVINTTSCAPPFVQEAGIAALEGPQDCVADLRAQLEARRDLIVSGLKRLTGCACAVPAGAFYAFPSFEPLLEELGVTAEGFARTLLDDFGLACVAGTAFGPGGADHIRLSFAASEHSLRKALELLAEATGPLAEGRVA